MTDYDPSTDAVDYVLSRLEGVKRSGREHYARCPAHEDDRASLEIRAGDRQPVILTCFVGCDPADILAAIGLSWSDLCAPREDDPGEWTPGGPAIAVYDYTDEDGKLLFQVCRTADKQFRQRVPDPTAKTGWRWRLQGARRVLSRLPKLRPAIDAGQAIWLVEGEKDVHALEGCGTVATTCPGGAGKWREEYTEHLREAYVHIVADRDPPGQKHAREVMAALDGVAAKVHIVEAAQGKDAADHLAAGLGLADFRVTSPGEPEPQLAMDIHEFLALEFPPEDWVINGLLERGDSLVWTGREGIGKSEVLRQFAVCAAAGVHPFTGTVTEPRTVLVVDCENSRRRNHRLYTDLVRVVQRRRLIPPGHLRLEQHPEGVNLATADDAEWLAERVRAHRPDLLIVGPFYKLHAVDTEAEVAARLVVAALDHARFAADCALILEAHAPHGAELRPIGSSLLCRWPDFGKGITYATYTTGKGRDRVVHRNPREVIVDDWRGPRDDRDWPLSLRYGNTARGEFPWVPASQEQTSEARTEPAAEPGWLPADQQVEQAAIADLRAAGLLNPEGED